MLQMTSVRTVRSMSYVPLCSCKSSGLSALEQFRDDSHIEIGLFPCPNACPCPTVLLHQGEHVVSTKLTLVKGSNSTQLAIIFWHYDTNRPTGRLAIPFGVPQGLHPRPSHFIHPNGKSKISPSCGAKARCGSQWPPQWSDGSTG